MYIGHGQISCIVLYGYGQYTSLLPSFIIIIQRKKNRNSGLPLHLCVKAPPQPYVSQAINGRSSYCNQARRALPESLVKCPKRQSMQLDAPAGRTTSEQPIHHRSVAKRIVGRRAVSITV